MPRGIKLPPLPPPPPMPDPLEELRGQQTLDAIAEESRIIHAAVDRRRLLAIAAKLEYNRTFREIARVFDVGSNAEAATSPTTIKALIEGRNPRRPI